MEKRRNGRGTDGGLSRLRENRPIQPHWSMYPNSSRPIIRSPQILRYLGSGFRSVLPGIAGGPSKRLLANRTSRPSMAALRVSSSRCSMPTLDRLPCPSHITGSIFGRRGILIWIICPSKRYGNTNSGSGVYTLAPTRTEGGPPQMKTRRLPCGLNR